MIKLFVFNPVMPNGKVPRSGEFMSHINLVKRTFNMEMLIRKTWKLMAKNILSVPLKRTNQTL